jgi:type IV secretion system protein VirB10
MTTLEPQAEAPTGDTPLDRAISPISGRFATGRRGKLLGLAGLMIGCAAFAAVTWRHAPAKAKAPDEPARQVVAFESAAPPTLAAPGRHAPSLTGTPEAGSDPSAAAAQAPASAKPTPAQEAASAAAQAQAAALQTVRAAPLMAVAHDGGTGGGLASALGGFPRLAQASARPETELEQLRHGSAIGTARARQLGDRSFLILAGTSLGCVLQTAMDTSTAGYVSCLIPKDVYSENGAVVLLEKGTKVLGEYRSGLKQGQNRLFVLWTRAVTPNGVAIDLASPASDALGRGGFDGDLDRHFWERFGAALLLSVVDDGASALANRSTATETVRLPSDAAGLAVQNAANIPATLRKAQGSEVAIFAAQDFDFSGVYGLQAR